jgi:hypothetical protein
VVRALDLNVGERLAAVRRVHRLLRRTYRPVRDRG